MLSVSFTEPAATLAADVLACVRSGGALSDDPRVIQLGTPTLAGAGLDEIWLGVAPVSAGVIDRFRFAHNGEYLFGHTRISAGEMADTATATQRAYAGLGAFLGEQGFPVLLRSWHYIQDIHRGAGDAERYRQFCVGRHRAVAAPGFEQSLPAATVIGTTAPGMLLYFLAGRKPGRQVENPRQTSAFRYPREYGPASPSFSRALLIEGGRMLLMSGTASVVGHETRHPHDSGGQLAEMLANVAALLQHAGGTHRVHWTPRLLRVFLRDHADLAMAQAGVRRMFGPDAPVVFMEGDICRTDLKLEIEGIFAAAPGD